MGNIKPLLDEVSANHPVVGLLMEHYEERLVKHHKAMEKGLSEPEYREAVGRCKEIRDTVKRILGRNVNVLEHFNTMNLRDAVIEDE